jgi:predicted nucleotide-binding protein
MEGQNNSISDISKQVLASITELAICKGSKELRTPWAGLRLRATLKENEDDILRQELDNLRDNLKAIDTWYMQGDHVLIVLSESQNIPSTNLSEKETVCDRAIRRALIYRLYEQYRKTGRDAVHYPLVQLKEVLESSQDEIIRHVLYLENEHYLEYGVMDGGMGTSDITHHGIKLCEAKSDLFSTFGTIQISTKEKSDQGLEMNEEAKRRVFVVHGRNEKARKALFSFLRALGLEPIEWEEAISYTGLGSPYTGDILDRAFQKAQAVIVLLTGDDISKLSFQYLKAEDPAYERDFTPQPRPNVLFEAGLAFGRHPDRTILVELGPNRPFSDIAGRHTVKLGNAANIRQELAARLRTAGCPVKIEGRTDWLSEGDFDAAIQEGTINITDEIRDLKPSFSSTTVEPSKLQNEILKFIAETDDKGHTAVQLSSHFHIPIVEMQHHLDGLASLEYVHTLLSMGGPAVYKFTQKGRSYTVQVLLDKQHRTTADIIHIVKKMRGVGTRPTPAEIAKKLGLTEDQVLDQLRKMYDELLITFYTSEGLKSDSELILGEKSFGPPYE